MKDQLLLDISHAIEAVKDEEERAKTNKKVPEKWKMDAAEDLLARSNADETDGDSEDDGNASRLKRAPKTPTVFYPGLTELRKSMKTTEMTCIDLEGQQFSFENHKFEEDMKQRDNEREERAKEHKMQHELELALPHAFNDGGNNVGHGQVL